MSRLLVIDVMHITLMVLHNCMHRAQLAVVLEKRGACTHLLEMLVRHHTEKATSSSHIPPRY